MDIEGTEGFTRTRVDAESPEDVRDRDEAHIDRLYVGEQRVGDSSGPSSYYDSQNEDAVGYAPIRATRRPE